MTATTATVLRLDRKRAEALTRDLREALDLAVELLGRAWRGEAWRALGYGSWAEYCREELPQLAVLVRGMPPEERRPKVAALRAAGMSLRAAAEVTGLSPNTVKADAAGAGVQLAEVIGLDGSRRSAVGSTPSPAKRTPKTDRAVALVAGAGPDGLTVRDVAKGLRCPQHMAAPTLARLVDSGRLVYAAPARRGLFGRYVAGTVSA